MMNEIFITDAEYPEYYANLNGLRKEIARLLPLPSESLILDVPTGSAYLAIEIGLCESSVNITGIDIASSDVVRARKELLRHALTEQVEIVRMDATNMGFRAGSFDVVTNFMGLEDIHMTRGLIGIQRFFSQVARVLKTGGNFCFTVMPPEEMETEAQMMETRVFNYVCGAKWFNLNYYEKLLNRTGLRLLEKGTLYTGKKLTPRQARQEIEYACTSVPEVYGVRTRTFDDVWSKFGPGIERHGLGHYSKSVYLKAIKTCASPS